MRIVLASVIAMFALVLVLNINQAGEKGPKYKIKDVMQKAMKGGLCKKVASGKASDEEKKELVELFTALSQNTPPKGEKESWEKKTGALLSAAKAIASGKDAGKDLAAAANCAACHGAHKGK